MGISKGLYNHTLTLQTFAETADGMGGVTNTWSDAGTFRGRVSSLTSDEKMSQDKVTNISTHKVFCDNMTVTPKDRIKWGSYYFEITGIINPSEMYHHLEIYLRELVNE